MSYLLEALKKSDKERKRGAIPDLQADHSRPSVRRKRKRTSSWYFVGVVALALSCGGGLFWWQYGNQATRSDESLPETAVSVVEKEVSVVIPNGQKASPAVVATVEPEPVVDENKETIPVVAVAFVPPLLDELPVTVRAAIPDLSFAGHVYSDVPQKRLIIINNRIVREGDLVVTGLTLEEIYNKGVILRYNSSVFRVELF